jgi:hypothetical protein
MHSAHEDNSYGTTTRSRSNIDLSSFLFISLIAPVQLKHLTQPPHCVVYCLFLECFYIILLMCSMEWKHPHAGGDRGTVLLI